MKFLYKKSLLGVSRPIIPVQLSLGDHRIDYEVLIDSGADVSLFDAQVADALGINLKECDVADIRGLTHHSQPCYLHPVTIYVGAIPLFLQVGFIHDTGSSYGIVGQKGFFEAFKIAFDRKNQEIALTTHV